MSSGGIGKLGGLWNLCRKTLNVQVVPAQLYIFIHIMKINVY
jgi:hypothetical protein